MEQKTPEQESMCDAIATGLIVLLFKTIGFVFLFLINWVALMLSLETDTSDPLADPFSGPDPSTRNDMVDDVYFWETDGRDDASGTWFSK